MTRTKEFHFYFYVTRRDLLKARKEQNPVCLIPLNWRYLRIISHLNSEGRPEQNGDCDPRRSFCQQIFSSFDNSKIFHSDNKLMESGSKVTNSMQVWTNDIASCVKCCNLLQSKFLRNFLSPNIKVSVDSFS